VEDNLRLILVGAGGFGQVWWRLNRPDTGVNARIVAVVDTDPSALDRSATDLELPQEARFSTLEEAISEVEADAVIDSTPPQFHLEHALLAFEHGLHLFTSKPMASTWREALQMTGAAENASLMLAVNEQLRFGWLPLAVQQVLQSGQIGTIEAIEVAFREPSSWQGWRASMEHPLLLDAAIQHFDMVRAVTGLEAESAFCRAWTRQQSSFYGAGSASAIFELTGGVPFTYTGTWDLSAQSDDTTGWWGVWRIQGGLGDLRAEGKLGLWVNGAASAVGVETLDVRRLSMVVLDQFIRGIRIGSMMPTDGWSDLRSLSMSELCIRSNRSGARAMASDLEEAPDDIIDDPFAPPGGAIELPAAGESRSGAADERPKSVETHTAEENAPEAPKSMPVTETNAPEAPGNAPESAPTDADGGKAVPEEDDSRSRIPSGPSQAARIDQ